MQDTIVAIRKGGDKLVVGNVVGDKYPTVEFSTDPNQVCTHSHTFWAVSTSLQRLHSDLQVSHLHSSSIAGGQGPSSCDQHSTCLSESQLGLCSVGLGVYISPIHDQRWPAVSLPGAPVMSCVLDCA